MKIEVEHASPLYLEKFRFLECHFKCSEGDFESVKGKLTLNHDIEDAGTDTYKITLNFSLDSEGGEIELAGKCVFYFDTKIEDTSLIAKNAIAIMFPYIRTYVSSLTLQSDVGPVVLPLINPRVMIKDS